MKTWKILFLIFLIIGSIFIITNTARYIHDSGTIFGTYYNVIYKSNEQIKPQIEEVLNRVDKSLSPFNKSSVISAINNNVDITPDSLFVEVFTLAQNISQKTGGAFDITVAPLVNAWGFGFKSGNGADSTTIDSIRRYVGYTTVNLSDGKIHKQHPETMLDCSAIAKGYGCDQVALLLNSMGITDYMIEIGGEVVAKGKNDKGKPWSIGISKPHEASSDNSLQTILHIRNKSMATSGNYRNFRYVDGRKVAHTIDPRTGNPVSHSLLSATVLADDCATADAYATAFMVMGLDEAIKLCKANKEIEAYFIFSDKDGNFDTFETEGLKQYY